MVISIPVLVIDPNHYILSANRASKEFFAISDPVSKHLTCYQIVHRFNMPCDEVDSRKYPCPLKKVLSTKMPAEARHVYHDDKGNTHLMKVICKPIIDNGKVVQIVEIFEEITEESKT